MIPELNKTFNWDWSLIDSWPEEMVNMVVTSPPYWNLRDYGIEPTYWPAMEYKMFGFTIAVPEMTCCLGLEENPHHFIGHLVHVFRSVRRVLKKDGTIWVNMGDSYASIGGGYSGANDRNSTISKGTREAILKGKPRKKMADIKAKDLMGMPWMMAMALREDGWYLRQDIIWSKTNPMPESARDRCTKSHEYIFLLSKSKKYYYDALAIATPYADKTYSTFGTMPKGYGDGTGMVASENWAARVPVRQPKQWKTPDGWDTAAGSHGTVHRLGREKGKVSAAHSFKRENSKRLEPIVGQQKGTHRPDRKESEPNGLANKRSVWTISTMAFKEAHFATFPPKLIEPCIKAGCPEGGVVLDIFMGSGTTGFVANQLKRNYLGTEISAKYCHIQEKRLRNLYNQNPIIYHDEVKRTLQNYA